MNMAGDPYPELPRAERKRLISRAVLLDLLTTAVLMVLYCLPPAGPPLRYRHLSGSHGSRQGAALPAPGGYRNSRDGRLSPYVTRREAQACKACKSDDTNDGLNRHDEHRCIVSAPPLTGVASLSPGNREDTIFLSSPSRRGSWNQRKCHIAMVVVSTVRTSATGQHSSNTSPAPVKINTRITRRNGIPRHTSVRLLRWSCKPLTSLYAGDGAWPASQGRCSRLDGRPSVNRAGYRFESYRGSRHRNRGCQPSHLRERRTRGNLMAHIAPARPKINTEVTQAASGQASRRPVSRGKSRQSARGPARVAGDARCSARDPGPSGARAGRGRGGGVEGRGVAGDKKWRATWTPTSASRTRQARG
jgi:hypothetical protein